jgi:hypothetical protein
MFSYATVLKKDTFLLLNFLEQLTLPVAPF